VYASVHTDRSGRVFVSQDRGAAAMGGTEPVPLTDAVALPAGTELIPLPREAIAYDRGGRARPLGPGRLAIAAIVPGRTRLAFPAYRDDPSTPALDPLPYAAVGANARGDVVVAVADGIERLADEGEGGGDALRMHPANALARQLARCAREHSCRSARAGLGRGLLPIPLGAPAAEHPRHPVALRSGYAGSPKDRAAFRPTAREVVELVAAHVERGGTGASFGRGCDGEPLARIRVLEEAAAAIRSRAPRAEIHLETCASDPTALRRALDAGVSSVTVRLGSARVGMYEELHGPSGHRWSEVRACLQLIAERRVALTIGLLVMPGLTDAPAEADAIAALLGELPGGRIELRDLGADPLRLLAALPPQRALGIRGLLARLAEADHFRIPLAETAAV
jgi:pyruvate-formate lyase-activating enzyme